MNNIVKSQKGITLMALIITVIVLLILAGVGIRELSGNKNDIKQTRDVLAKAELDKIQQLALENYFKYLQIGNISFIVGEPIDYDDAQRELTRIKPGEKLKGNSNPDLISNPQDIKPEDKYYKLNKYDLKKLGMENISNDDEYIINYSTGEVFNIVQQRTSKDEALYVYAKNKSN